MNRILPVFCLLLMLAAPPDVQAQDAHRSIRETFARYRQLTLEKDYAALMDYLYPRLFDLVSREQMVAIFQGLDSEQMQFSFRDMRIDSISNLFTCGGEQFALVYYSGELNIDLRSASAADTTAMLAVQDMMAVTYGERNVRLQPAASSEASRLNILMNKSLFAIAPKGSQNWKFIENDPTREGLLDYFLPGDVRVHFALHRE